MPIICFKFRVLLYFTLFRVFRVLKVYRNDVTTKINVFVISAGTA